MTNPLSTSYSGEVKGVSLKISNKTRMLVFIMVLARATGNRKKKTKQVRKGEVKLQTKVSYE